MYIYSMLERKFWQKSKHLSSKAKAAFVEAGNKEADIRTIDVYVKPEENAAYFAVNGIGSDDYKVEL